MYMCNVWNQLYMNLIECVYVCACIQFCSLVYTPRQNLIDDNNFMDYKNGTLFNTVLNELFYIITVMILSIYTKDF